MFLRRKFHSTNVPSTKVPFDQCSFDESVFDESVFDESVVSLCRRVAEDIYRNNICQRLDNIYR